MTVTASTAVKAAVEVGRRHDLVVAWPRVLHVGANVVVHLAPAPVVARVAAATAMVRPDPASHLHTEVELARFAAAQGAPVLSPCAGDLAGPHRHDGHVMSLWPLVAPAVFPDDAASVGRALAALHGALATYDAELPGPERIGGDAHRIAQLLGRLGVMPDDEVAAASDETRVAVAALRSLPVDRWRALHGDPHPRNAVIDPSAPDGVLWWDLEDAWRGPVEFDLAVLLRTTHLDGRVALGAYLEATAYELDPDVLDACLALRDVQRVWAPWLTHYRASG